MSSASFLRGAATKQRKFKFQIKLIPDYSLILRFRVVRSRFVSFKPSGLLGFARPGVWAAKMSHPFMSFPDLKPDLVSYQILS